ncbi:MAG: hypothetical protein V4812_00910 [Pseudomonadota bacterium]
MNRFSRYLLQFVLAWLAPLALLPAHGALLSINVQPPQQQLQANQDNSLAVSWRLTSTPPGSPPTGGPGGPGGGVSSPSALVVDPASGMVLATLGGFLNQGGSGPYLLSEFIQLPADSVQEWQRRGLRRLLLVRDFTDASGSSLRGQLVLNLPSAELRAVTVQPAQRQLIPGQDNSLMLAWQVTATGEYSGAVLSRQASLVDPASGAVLGTLGGPLRGEGRAPFMLNEQLDLPAASVQAWQASGIRRVLVQREFSAEAGGPLLRGQMVLTLPSAELRAVTVQPAQRQLLGNQDNRLMLTWQVTTRSDYSGAVSSRQANVVDPASGAVLGTLGGPLRGEGRAPFVLNEQLDLPAASVQAWLASGIRRVVVQREFSADGAPLRGQMLLSLVSSDLRAPRENQSGELRVQRLSLSFMDNQKIALVAPGSALTAKVLLAYSGNGLLEGRWQVAEPGSSEGQPFYRTLTLVRPFLGDSQQSTLQSPPLPTDKAGKYRLRFCVGNGEQAPGDDLVLDYGCPNEALTVETVYQVLGSAGPDAQSLIGVSPQSGTVDAKTPFEWRAVDAAVVYRVQFFATGPQADSEAEVLGESPSFIAGMLLPASLTQTTLSNLLRSKLEPDRYYLWRVTAHDENGDLIGRSHEWRVRYQP